jgi:hypothetical protein
VTEVVSRDNACDEEYSLRSSIHSFSAHNYVYGVAYHGFVRFKEQGTWRHLFPAQISRIETIQDPEVQVNVSRQTQNIGNRSKLCITHAQAVFEIAFGDEVQCGNFKEDLERLVAMAQGAVRR